MTSTIFQFHKGTIRTSALLPASSLVVNFNSIKVRLERQGWRAGSPASPFQFHKGTIRTADADTCEQVEAHFNSIKVRLEQDAEEVEKQRKAISIP